MKSKANNGTAFSPESFSAESIEMINPISCAPESPRNSFFFFRLYGKKPTAAPQSAADTPPEKKSPETSDKTLRKNEHTAPSPAERPSIPSIRLKEFVIATITRIVNGSDKIPVPQVISPIRNDVIRMPERKAIKAADI